MLRVAWAIARRDYAAAVFSKLFLLFLVLPFVAAGLGGLFGAVRGGQGAESPPMPVVAVPPAQAPSLSAARGRLAGLLGDGAVPRVVAGMGGVATLSGPPGRQLLALHSGAPEGLDGAMALIVAEARAPALVGVRSLATVRDRAAAPPDAQTGADLGRATQYAMFILTIMLAGRLLANFIEERGNKVIEVLAAAAPVDAIFLGKLLGMLLFSLTCVAAWGGAGLALVAATAPHVLAALPSPAVGWWAFVPLTLLYFAADYLLFGTILLGLGAHARSPADVQTLALPTTIAQFLLFGLAAIDVGRPDHWIATAAAVLPWSSPLALAARAAERPDWRPHVVGLSWQALWLWASIRFASARFRRAILGSAR
ncbi:ABC transporter permease [Sphingomonas sp.]|uniref:ABC transporter permease n=1 Tax=Sphingomonas sp. TaxID=28214 RepID=UPI003B00A1E1